MRKERKQQRRMGICGSLSPSQGQEPTGHEKPSGQEWDKMPRSSVVSTSDLLPDLSLFALGIAKAGAISRDGPGPDVTCLTTQP